MSIGINTDEAQAYARYEQQSRDKVEVVENVSEKSDTAPKTADDYETTQEFVESYFSDAPVMARVAYCESHFRHFNKSGTILRGAVTPKDVGVMQINEGYHSETAKRLGYDIHTLEGNVAYARHLYETQGVQPWSASKKCWSNTEHIAMR